MPAAKLAAGAHPRTESPHMRFLTTIVAAIGGVLIAILVGITALSVFMRYVMNTPFQWTEEASGILMIWIVMLGAISCEWRRQHLTIDFVVGAMAPRIRRVAEAIVGLASVGVLLSMSWLAWELAQTATFKRTQILRVSWFWMDLAVVVGAAATALVVLWHLFVRAPDPILSDETRH